MEMFQNNTYAADDYLWDSNFISLLIPEEQINLGTPTAIGHNLHI